MKIFQNNYFNYFTKANDMFAMTTNKTNLSSKNINNNQNYYFDKSANIMNNISFNTSKNEINFCRIPKTIPAEYQQKITEMHRGGVQREVVIELFLKLTELGYMLKGIHKILKLPYQTFQKHFANTEGILQMYEQSKLIYKKNIVDTVIKDTEEGSSLTDIAKKLNLSVTTLAEYINDIEGGRQRYEQAKLTYKTTYEKNIVDTVIKGIEEGGSLTDIAKKLNLSVNTLEKYINDIEGSRQRYEQVKLTHKNNIKKKSFEMRDKGYSIEKIAKELKLSQPTISDYLGEDKKASERHAQTKIRTIVSRIMQLFDSGMSRKEVAKELKEHPNNISKQLKRNEQIYQEYQTHINDVVEKVKKMSDEGHLIEEISQQINVSVEGILNYLHTDKKQYDEFFCNKVIQMLLKRYSLDDIAKEFHYTKDKLMNKIYEYKKIGPIYKKYKILIKLSTEDIEKIRELHWQGVSSLQIAHDMNLDERFVQKIIRLKFATQEEYDKYLEERKNNKIVIMKAQINKLKAQGLTYKEIGQILNCSESKIRDYKKM